MIYTGVVLVLNQDSRKIAYTGVDFSPKSGFTKIVLTPGLPLTGKFVKLPMMEWIHDPSSSSPAVVLGTEKITVQ